MATIKEVAKKANVSIATVSRAFNDNSEINKETKQRILGISRELGYTPNLAAKRLVKQKSKTIGFIFSGVDYDNYIGDTRNMLFDIMGGAFDYSDSIGYELAVYASNQKKQKDKSYLQFCLERNIDGVIIQGLGTDSQYFRELTDSKIPCVLIDVHVQGENIGCVTIDNVQAAMDAVEFLIENNHKNIAFMNGYSEAMVSVDRYSGYVAALKKHQLPVIRDYVANGGFLFEKAHQEAKKMLTNHPEITAIFCASDIMAFGVIKTAKEMNLDIPGQLSVIGFDNIPICEYMMPRLTTIFQNPYEMGMKAASLLMSIKNKKVENYTIYLPYKLVIRDSVGKI